MGRRALRSIHPQLDYSGQFRCLEELSAPMSFEQLFEQSLPLEVEMGSGKGLFLERACSSHPDHNFLGVEVSGQYARYAAARLARKDCRNGIVIHGDGLRLFQEFLPTASAAAVHVYFPDPWWKKRHHKRRIMTPAFIEQIQRVLQPRGVLHFWTDVREYFDATLEYIAPFSQLNGPHAVTTATAEHDMDYRTHFERRTRLAEEPVFRAQFVRH